VASQSREEEPQRSADELASAAAEERHADEELRHELGECGAQAQPEIQQERQHDSKEVTPPGGA
jgi:hypothetical protein